MPKEMKCKMTPSLEKLIWLGIIIRICTIAGLASARRSTPTPSLAPVVITMRANPTVTAANATNETCSICPVGQYVGDPTKPLEDPFTSENTTCLGIQMLALSGSYTAKQCSGLLKEYNKTCGCTDLKNATSPPSSPSAEPVASPAPSSASETNTSKPVTAPPSPKPTGKPSLAPTAAPTTPLPTPAPTPAATTLSPTAAWTPSPTRTPIETNGSVIIVLSAFEELMSTVAIQTYQDSVATFYHENMPPFLSFHTTLFSQEFVSSRRLKNGNTTALNSIQTILNVTALSFDVVEDFNSVLLAKVNENATGLIDVIQGSEESDAALYFSQLDSVVAIDPANLIPSPSPLEQETVPQDSGLGLGAIIGIALGGVGVFFIIIVVIICIRQDDDDDDLMPITPAGNQFENAVLESSSRPNGNSPVATSGAQRKSNTSSLESHFNTEEQDPNGRRQPLSTFSSESIPTVESDNLTFTTSGLQSALGNQSYLGTEYGGDAMSYTYSLDAGNMGQSVTGTLAGGGGGTEGGASSAFVGTTVGDDSASALSQRQLMVARDVMAPPGKLGIVIDTTLDGPVVHKVNPKSPLEGLLFPGDIIIAIDDVDTRAMSASAITALMVRTANQQRKLRVLSEDDAT